MVTISDVVEPNSNGSSDFDQQRLFQLNSLFRLMIIVWKTSLFPLAKPCSTWLEITCPASDNLQTVDTVNPDVTGASNDVAEGVKVSDVDPEVVYTITFSEAIDSLSAADLGVTGAAISDVTLDGNGEFATVTVVADDNSEAPITVSVRDSVTDIAGK